jgi:hypothetical protein
MTAELVAMRLANMARVHPAQDNSRACSKCGRQVGIYPSGQRALRHNPKIKIVCEVCALAGPPFDVSISAAPWPEIAQEKRDSVDVSKT